MIYTIYRSEIHGHGSERDYYTKYIITSLLLTTFWSVVFLLDYRKKAYVILYFCCFVLAFYFFEGYLNFSKSSRNLLSKKVDLYESLTNEVFDKRTKHQFLKAEQVKNPNTVLAISPQNHQANKEVVELLPLFGISRSKTVYCNENGYFSTYLSDRHGFNNPDSEWDRNIIDYVLIGDSFVHGACVNRPYDIASNLRRLTKKPVLNLGFGGNGPLTELATLREYLDPKMKKIIWVYYAGNDMKDLKRELKIKILNRYIQDKSFKQNLKKQQASVDRLNRKILEKYEEKDKTSNTFTFSKVVNFFKLVETRKMLSKELPAYQSKELDQLSHNYLFKILKLVKNLADENKSKLFFVYLPYYDSFKFNAENTHLNDIESFLRTLDVPLVNIYKEMTRHSDKPIDFYPFGLPGHFNAKGYEMVSKSILEITDKQ